MDGCRMTPQFGVLYGNRLILLNLLLWHLHINTYFFVPINAVVIPQACEIALAIDEIK